MKLSKNNKYLIDQSPLFKLKGKLQFETLLNIKWEQCEPVNLNKKYRIKIDGKRTYQIPSGFLVAIHNKIAKLLKKIIKPPYLHSTKGKSYITNALQHIGEHCLIKTDICKFYPSTTFEMVYQLFLKDFKCAKDIAYKLASLCCYNQKHLPTGSPLSNEIAFLCAKKLFNEIESSLLNINPKLIMTVYVDDICISGSGATKRLLTDIRKRIAAYGYKTKNSKSRTYPAQTVKLVTGAIVSDTKLFLPNKQHKKIKELRKSIASADNHTSPYLRSVLNGCLLNATQITKAGT